MRNFILFSAITAVMLSGCGKDNDTATKAAQSAPAAKLAPAEVILKDSAEAMPNGLIAISYDPAVGQYKGAVDLVEKYTATAVAGFKSKIASLPAARSPESKPTLSLNYTSIANTTRFATIALNGSEYVSGSAATPLMERWVWLPTSKSVLTPAAFLGKNLATVTARGAGGKLVGMEPSADADGRISVVHFVFAKDDEADAVDKVRFAASELKPLVAASYRDLLGQDPAK